MNKKKVKVKLYFDDIRMKKITLFLWESLIMQKYRPVDDVFVNQLNNFIYSYYNNNKELFDCLFCERIVKRYIKEDKDMFSLEEIVSLIIQYKGFNGYIKLLDDISLEDQDKINDLALLFTSYYEEIMTLYEETIKPGYVRILN